MGADTPPGMEYQPGTNVTVSLSGDDSDELRSCWVKLSDGGTMSVPLEKQMRDDDSANAWTSSASDGSSTSGNRGPEAVDRPRNLLNRQVLTRTPPHTCTH